MRSKSSIIIDAHVDVPYRVHDSREDVTVATDSGDFDYPRALEGALNAPFMSIYTQAELEATGGSRELADELIDLVEDIVARAPDKGPLRPPTERGRGGLKLYFFFFFFFFFFFLDLRGSSSSSS